MNVIIVDDESPARDRLRRLLDELDDYRVIGEAGNGQEALQLCHELHPDIVLLDIRMPGVDGIETAQHLSRSENGPAIIFTTAYDEYAVDAFDAQAVGYLLKPVRRERLEKALRQAARLAKPQIDALPGNATGQSARRNVCARKGDELRLIPIENIISFTADQKYVTARHLHGEDLIDDSLKSLAEEFNDRFIRIHRSTLIAVAYLEKLDKDADGHYRVWLRHADQPLPVSRRHVTEVKTFVKRAR